jgi:ATP-binding protein involved in chromosome partitioning
MDEAQVRSVLAGAKSEDGKPLLVPAEIAQVVIEGDWIAVGLMRPEGLERSFVAKVHRHLQGAFPQCEVEIRSGRSIFRGGLGFGEGRHLIAVLGGKGGVGKSTIAVNLAITLWAMGVPIGLLDGDLNAPDIPHLLGIDPGAEKKSRWRAPTGIVPPSRRRRPRGRHNLEIMSVGFMVPERRPMAITGQWFVSNLLRNLIYDVAWTARVVLIDCPPGTGEEIQLMARELPIAGALFVTTPQDLAQMDAERTLTLLRELGVPVIGMIQNMASLTCPHCEQPIDLYAQSTRLQEAGVPIIGQVRFDTRLSAMADRGTPLVLADPRGPIAHEFARIGASVRRWLATHN